MECGQSLLMEGVEVGLRWVACQAQRTRGIRARHERVSAEPRLHLEALPLRALAPQMSRRNPWTPRLTPRRLTRSPKMLAKRQRIQRERPEHLRAPPMTS